MGDGNTIFLSGETTFKVPYPPAVLRLPPPVYRLPPRTEDGLRSRIPSPPFGARVPGDRIVWKPKEFEDKNPVVGKAQSKIGAVSEFDPEVIIVADDSLSSCLMDHSSHSPETSPLIIDHQSEESEGISSEEIIVIHRVDLAAETNSDTSTQKPSFKLNSGVIVFEGDWIRDRFLGFGRILQLNSDPNKPDHHCVWFKGKNKNGDIFDSHSLLPNTLGVIDKSMLPPAILNAAPDTDH